MMRATSVRAIDHAIVTSVDEPNQDLDASTDQRVREAPMVREDRSRPNQAIQRPAHPSNRLVAQLNANWRVVDDPLQWKLQRKKGNPRTEELRLAGPLLLHHAGRTAALRPRVLR